jgi:hypothetical protein
MTYFVAVTTSNGADIDLHFGKTEEFTILEVCVETGAYTFKEKRKLTRDVPDQAGAGHGCIGGDDARLEEAVRILSDCPYLLTGKIGLRPYRVLLQNRINSMEAPFDISKAVEKLNIYYRKNIK